MWNIVYKDLVQLRSYLLQMVAVVGLMLIVFGGTSGEFAMIYLYTAPVVLAMALPQMNLGLEERGNTLGFLRSLPIRPSEIVAAKYLLSVIVTLFFLMMIGLAALAGITSVSSALLAISVVAPASLVLAGVSYLLHFWLGQKSARAATFLIGSAWTVVGMWGVMRLGGPAAVTQKLAWLKPLATSWAGVGLAGSLGLAVLAVSGLASASLFTKRDLSRLL